jgi:hypothetical protein
LPRLLLLLAKRPFKNANSGKMDKRKREKFGLVALILHKRAAAGTC